VECSYQSRETGRRIATGFLWTHLSANKTWGRSEFREKKMKYKYAGTFAIAVLICLIFMTLFGVDSKIRDDGFVLGVSYSLIVILRRDY